MIPDITQSHTFSNSAQIQGIGVHSGQKVNLHIHPADLGSGIIFIRTDKDKQEIPARWDTVLNTQNNTTIGNESGVTVSTIEHLMAAFAALGIDDARVELDGPEMPIMDGSAAPFIDLVKQARIKKNGGKRPVIHILKPVTFEGDNDRKVELTPADSPLIKVDFGFHGRVNFPNQTYSFNPLTDSFADDIAPARTFGLLEDAEKIKTMGLARGASLENTIVYDKERIVNPEGLRFDTECARHKILDVVGDLHLAGGLIWGQYHGVQTGHSLNNKILRELFSKPECFEIS
jgi:UDP-3-O-[3-hydroxymyristoyl] N-acetylglucosamine deacetylase